MPRWNAVETPSSRPRPQDGFPEIIEVMNLLDHYDEVLARFVKDADGNISLEVDGSPIGGGSLPAGGTTGQVLTKASDADGDADWEDGAGSQVQNFYKGADYATFGDSLPSYTYDNGASGIGATITAGSNGALDIYGDNPANGDRVVVLGAATQMENGIYDVTSAGDGSNPFILTRSDDFNLSAQIIEGASIVIAPNTNGRWAGTILYVSTQSSPTIGSNDIDFTSIRLEAQVETIQAGSGISVDDTDPTNPIVSATANLEVADETERFALTDIARGTEVYQQDNGFFYKFIGTDPSDVDHWQGIPKVYMANVTQTGTSAPTSVVIQNTLDNVPEWVYGGIGDYNLNADPGTFPRDKTVVNGIFGELQDNQTWFPFFEFQDPGYLLTKNWKMGPQNLTGHQCALYCILADGSDLVDLEGTVQIKIEVFP